MQPEKYKYLYSEKRVTTYDYIYFRVLPLMTNLSNIPPYFSTNISPPVSSDGRKKQHLRINNKNITLRNSVKTTLETNSIIKFVQFEIGTFTHTHSVADEA